MEENILALSIVKILPQKEEEESLTLMDQPMMVNGHKDSFMVKESTLGLIELHMTEVINMDSNMAMESMCTPLKISIKANG